MHRQLVDCLPAEEEKATVVTRDCTSVTLARTRVKETTARLRAVFIYISCSYAAIPYISNSFISELKSVFYRRAIICNGDV